VNNRQKATTQTSGTTLARPGMTSDERRTSAALSRGRGPQRIPAVFLPRGMTQTHTHTEAEVSAKLGGNSAEA